MYSCKLKIYLLGKSNPVFTEFKKLTPYKNFTHTFVEAEDIRIEEIDTSDIVVALLNRKEDIDSIIEHVKCKTELIILADSTMADYISTFENRIYDIWVMPMSTNEIKFRISRWYRQCKQDKDFIETSHFLDVTINSSPNLIWYKTRDGIHEKVNDAFCSTVGKSKAEVEGKGHAYIWNVEHDDPVCIESERLVMEKKTTLVSEEIIETGVVGKRILTAYKSPLYDLDGTVMGTIGMAIDVTKERLYQEEIVHKNRTLETILATSDCGIITHTLGQDSKVLSVNNAALKILGYASEDEMVEKGFNMVADSVSEEDKPRLRDIICALKTAGESASFEYKVVHEDGSTIHVMGNAKLMEEDGELVCQRFLFDCTEQNLEKQREKAEIERHNAELIQALGIDYNIICFYDLNTGIGSPIRINDCQYRMLETIFTEGSKLEDCIAKYIDSCVYDDDKWALLNAITIENLKNEINKNKQWYFNYRTFCGQTIHYFQVKAVKTGVWNSKKGIVIGFRNIDNEMAVELKQRKLLETALIEAKAASNAKSAFLSNMSHDIRTPMNAIINFTSLALSHLNHPEQVENFLEKIKVSGNHLLNLINDVLDMSKIESGKICLGDNQTSLAAFVHEIGNVVYTDVHSKLLNLYIDTEIEHEVIYCDKLRLNQIMINIISNSVKYTNPGGMIKFEITEYPGAPYGYANYEFKITDTGIGMSKEFLSRIFEPFEREKNTTLSGVQGTGLGMAITKNIIDIMKGTINIESEKDVGTVVKVNFTFKVDNLAETYNLSNLNDKRVLVIDSDFRICNSISSTLEKVGLRADWTMSSIEAIKRCEHAIKHDDKFDIIILDWMLDDTNGIELCKQILSSFENYHPVVIMLAYDSTDLEIIAKEAGITQFCSKPLFMSELCETLKNIFEADKIKIEDSSSLRSGTVLLVEDNEINQEIAKCILEEAGFKVEVADNGKIAVDKLQEYEPGHFDIVLMDIQMPVMDGYEATQQIRKLDDANLASIPIIAMTANAFEEDRKRALDSNMDGYIPKPIDVTKLLTTMDSLMQK